MNVHGQQNKLVNELYGVFPLFYKISHSMRNMIKSKQNTG